MATATAPALHLCSCAGTTSALARGASASKSLQRTSVRISPARAWPSHVSHHRHRVSAEYRRGGGVGDLVAGVLLGGAVFGALGYILAPQILKSQEEVDDVRDDRAENKRSARFLKDDEGLEGFTFGSSEVQKTRQNLNEKIAELNAAINNVSAQLRTEESLTTSNTNNV